MRVGVVGGGAVGVTTAHDLATRGADVTLFERGGIAAGSSGRAAGVCYDAFSDRRDAALGRRALERFRALDGAGAFRFTDRPYVWLARAGDDRRAGAVGEQVPRMREHGLDVVLVDPERLGERFPALVTGDVAVAAVAENAGATDPATYTRTIAERARDEGVDLRENAPARLGDGPTLTTGDGGDTEEVDAVVVAAGAHAASLLRGLDIGIPVKPYRVQALETEPVDVDPPMLYDATGGYYLRPRGGGLLVGDGTEAVERDPDDWEAEADGWFLEDCLRYEERALGRSWPAERAWAGLCTATPDGDPLVGAVAPDVYVATGWQGHGFMLAPAVAERLAAQVLGEEGIRGFEPSRFDGDETFEIVEGMALDDR